MHRLVISAYDILGLKSSMMSALGLKSPVVSVETKPSQTISDAKRFIESGLITEAVDVLLTLQQKDPDNAECNSLLGSLLLALNQYDTAEKFLFTACTLSNWTDPIAVANLGISLKEKRDFELGMKVLSKGLQSAGTADTTGVISNAIGDLHFSFQNYSQAADWYLMTAFKRPNDVELWIKASTISFPSQGRDLKFAENVLLRALEAIPNNAAILYNIGLVLFFSERLEESVAFYEESLRIDGTSFDAKAALATSLHSLERFHDALPWYENALQQESANVVLLSNYALLLKALGMDAQAIEAAKKAAALDPSSSEAQLAMDVSGVSNP